MFIAITGTPGTGKTSVSKLLSDNFKIIDLNKISIDNDLLLGIDKERNSKIVDIDKLNDFIFKNYSKENLIFFESHISHLLRSMDKIIILRAHPNFLKKNLQKKSWKKEKIKENLESEILDIILCEASDVHDIENIIEIDTTNKSINEIYNIIFKLINSNFKDSKRYKIGKIDWSEEILKDY